MKVIQAPNDYPTDQDILIFLAGSIEMGKAERWQDRVCAALEGFDVILLNPRRDDWDSSWVQRKSDPQFSEQVNWELSALRDSDVIVMYFAPGTESPISLLEFGLYAESGKLYVACPVEFWRRGNVEIVCDRYGITLFDSLDDLLANLMPDLKAVLDMKKSFGSPRSDFGALFKLVKIG